MNRKFLILYLLVAAILPALANGQGRISGQLSDKTNTSLINATVQVFDNKSVIISTTISDKDGKFEVVKLKAGSYLLSLSATGYVPVKFSFQLKEADTAIYLGAFVLENGINVLQDVNVVARKPLYEYKIDRTVVNVQSNIAAAGSTILDILDRSPGVTVNRQSSQLSLNGKSGLLVMINGKISRQPMDALFQLLESMSAANIERIELIPIPPAQYDAGSNAGMINIVLKRLPEEGTLGTFGLMTGYGRGFKTGANLSLSTHRGRVTLFGDMAFATNYLYQYFTNTRNSIILSQSTHTYTESDRHPSTKNMNGRIGLDYSFNNTSVGAVLSGFHNTWQMDANNSTSISQASSPSKYITSMNTETNRWKHLMGNVYLIHSFSKKQQINIDLDYLHYQADNPTTYNYTYFDGQHTRTADSLKRAGKSTPINVFAGKMNYIRQFNKTRFEGGLNATFSRFTNDVALESYKGTQWVQDQNLSRSSYLTENIVAAYSVLDAEIGKKISLKAGLRYEHTKTDLGLKPNQNLLYRKYGNLFPSIFLSYRIREGETLVGSYGRRITRPAYRDLAPFVIFLDPTTYFYGNDSLQPAFADAFRFSYQAKKYTVSLEFSHQNNSILQYEPTVVPGYDLQVITSLNLDYKNTYSALLFLPFKVNSWWNMENNFMGVYQQMQTKHLKNNFLMDNSNFRISTTQNFRLPHAYTVALSGYYQSESLSGLSINKPYGTVDIGVQKKIQHDKGTLRFSFTDIFWTAIERNILFSPANNMDIYALFKYEPQVFRLNYTYSFGNNKAKTVKKRESGSQDIKGRIN